MKAKGVFNWRVEVEANVGKEKSDFAIEDLLYLSFKNRIEKMEDCGALSIEILDNYEFYRIEN